MRTTVGRAWNERQNAALKAELDAQGTPYGSPAATGQPQDDHERELDHLSGVQRDLIGHAPNRGGGGNKTVFRKHGGETVQVELMGAKSRGGRGGGGGSRFKSTKSGTKLCPHCHLEVCACRESPAGKSFIQETVPVDVADFIERSLKRKLRLEHILQWFLELPRGEAFEEEVATMNGHLGARDTSDERRPGAMGAPHLFRTESRLVRQRANEDFVDRLYRVRKDHRAIRGGHIVAAAVTFYMRCCKLYGNGCPRQVGLPTSSSLREMGVISDRLQLLHLRAVNGPLEVMRMNAEFGAPMARALVEYEQIFNKLAHERREC